MIYLLFMHSGELRGTVLWDTEGKCFNYRVGHCFKDTLFNLKATQHCIQQVLKSCLTHLGIEPIICEINNTICYDPERYDQL